MFKHPKCGGSHQTVAEARACEEKGGVITMEHRSPLTGQQYAKPVDGYSVPLRSGQHTTATRQHQAEAMDRLRSQSVRSINAPRTANLATDGQMKYATDLLAKRDWQGRNSTQAIPIIEKLAHGVRPTFEEARYLITELKDMPRKEQGSETMDRHGFADPHPTSPQGMPTRRQWEEAKRLKEQVPDGRYAVDLPDEHKVKFFRIRTNKANGYFRITHVVSDDRFPWPVKRYAEVLRAIIAATPQAAGLRFADEYGQCFNCGRALTDTDNPYKPYGLGPDCGPKRMG